MMNGEMSPDMLAQLLQQQEQEQMIESPEQEVLNMKEYSRYLAMVNQLKAKKGKAEKQSVDADIAEKEYKMALEQAKMQGQF